MSLASFNPFQVGPIHPPFCPAQYQSIGPLNYLTVPMYLSIIHLPYHPPSSSMLQVTICQFIAMLFLCARPRAEHWKQSKDKTLTSPL